MHVALQITFWVMGFLVVCWLAQAAICFLIFRNMAGKAEKRISDFTKTKMRQTARRNTVSKGGVPPGVTGW